MPKVSRTPKIVERAFSTSDLICNGNIAFQAFNKRAIVFKTIEKDHQFFETASVNPGPRVKAFTDADKVLKWLTT